MTAQPDFAPAGVTWQRFKTPCRANYQMLLDGKPTGAWVRDCGHPTALRPYYVVRPGGWILARKFRLLVDAKLAAIAAVNGEDDGNG